MTHDLAAHWYTINHLAMHPQGKLLASASRDKTIRLWDMSDFSLVKTLDATNEGHLNSVNHLTWSSSGAKLYGASDDRTISAWSITEAASKN
jgi:WD40 repeat protein